MSVVSNNILAGASGQGGATDYAIERSLRFNSGDSAYLNRTPSAAGNRKTWTWSAWVKKSGQGSNQFFFGAGPDDGGNTNQIQFFFTPNDKFRITTAQVVFRETTQVFRDPSSFFHLVVAFDTTQSTANDRIKIYINGSQVTDFSSTNNPTQNDDTGVNSAADHRIGQGSGASYSGSSYAFNGYLADVHFIDGQALAPTDFGETDDNGVWQPKEFTSEVADTFDVFGLVTNGAQSVKNISELTSLATNVSHFSTGSTAHNSLTADFGSVGSHKITAGDYLGSTSFPNIYISDNGTSWTGITVGQSPFSFTGRYIQFARTSGSGYGGVYLSAVNLNSFHLPFKDNSSNAALGTDTSGNSNTWTVNNLSVAAGSGNDSLVDTPTNGTQTDSGAGGEVVGNYATLNALNKGSNITLKDGNLGLTASGHSNVLSTIAVTSGMKTYMESTVITDGTLGWGFTINPQAESNYSTVAGKWWVYDNGSNFSINTQTTNVPYGVRVVVGDVLQLAVDYDAGKAFVGINNTWINSTNGTDGNPSTGANPTFTFSTTDPIFLLSHLQSGELAVNYGQRAFAYAAPSGYKSLNTANLPEPTIADGSKYFEAKKYDGNNATAQTISGFNFSPDFIWYKHRSGGSSHGLFDIVRGVNSYLSSNSTAAQYNPSDFGLTAISSFNSDGFSLGNDTGANGSGTWISWAWDAGSSTVSNTDGTITSQVRANPSAGFSICTYTGNGSGGATFGHGLNASPGMCIIACRNTTNYWDTWHSGYYVAGSKNYIRLQTTGGAGYSSDMFGTPTSSVMTLGTSASMNGNNNTYVAYCFAPVEGYSAMGSYTGNGSTDGVFVYTGFRPAWLLLKNTTSSGELWFLLDSSRDPENPNTLLLQPNTSDAEIDNATNYSTDLLSNGFKLRSSTSRNNSSGDTFLFTAFAENPFKTARAR